MRTGVVGSLRGPIIVRGELYQQAAAGLLDAVRDGGTAFEHVYGERFFEHLDHHAEHGAAFQDSMAGRAENEAADVVAAYDFGALDSIVDVGGGDGVLLEAVVRSNARLSATLVDRPEVVDRARDRLTAAGLAHRCRFAAGDFFTSIPAGADAYLLSRVLHDWNDVDAGRILATCRKAMTEHSRLLIVEAILPRWASERPAAIRMDLHMMVLLGSRERTEHAFRQLLSDAGFAIRAVTMASSPVGLAVIEAYRTPDAGQV
jgi:ubiquinone/menaquinone biosynthesis C-methylase UbiE